MRTDVRWKMRMVLGVWLLAACGKAASGETCVSDDDCESGQCLSTGSEGVCASTDNKTNDVPSEDTQTAAPEREIELLPPAQTDRYVFVPNVDRDTVTRIDARTHQVDTIGVGDEPRIVLATSDSARAVVFTAGDDAVSVVDAE